MFEKKDRVVVAVSGGADSVCLLRVLYELRKALGIDLMVCHFDHGLRPEEDEEETRFVRNLAESFDLPFVTEKASGELRAGGRSLEETARNLRYVFLEEVMHHYSAQKIAVGHTRDDQAETVLMRLLRGSGTSGLSGIPPVRDGVIVRPLIDLTREEIVEYLSRTGLGYVTDSSNLDTTLLRNDIRLDILPFLKERQPELVKILGRTAEILREEREWLEAEAKEWICLQGQVGPFQEVAIPLNEFNSLCKAKQNHVVREALKISGGSLRRITSENIEAMKRVARGENPHARIALPGAQTFRRVYDHLIFSAKKAEETGDFFLLIDKQGVFRLQQPPWTITIVEYPRVDSEPMTESSESAFFDADRITFPLTVRNIRQGDRFIPLGMKGHKKLKNFFIDGKIPAEERRTIPLLLTGDQIMWICGYRMDDRFKVTPQTKKLLQVDFQRFEDPNNSTTQLLNHSTI
ncbi:MAG: tRNA lysidine(34) synthetase TilS [Deltaproteobacteria bacterium]|nr:tRNA lysidine(34) synthetase TilS [Deltaproteobacteria bacterium]